MNTTDIECLIYKWDIIKNDNKYIVYGFGHDNNNKTVAIRINDFKSYAYIENDIEKIKYILQKININEITLSKINKKRLHNYNLGYQEYIKIESNNPKIIDFVTNNTKFEKNINLYLKFLTFCNIQGTGWIKIPNKILHNKEANVDHEYVVKYSDIKDFKKDAISKPNILAVDIECYSSNNNSLPDSNNPNDVIFMISLVTRNKKYILYLWNKEENIETYNVNYIKYDNEINLLKGYFDIINEINPDIIIGYNILNFDFKYISERYKGNKIPNYSKLVKIGKTKEIKTKWSSSAFGNNDLVIFDSSGRTVIDIYQFIKRYYRLDKYSLNYVSNHFINKSKIDLPIKDLFNYFKKNDKESIIKIAEYCLEDSNILIDLFDNLSIWIALMQLSNISHTPIQDITTRGQEYILKPKFYKICNKLNIIIDQNNYSYIDEYQGATVLEPNPGLYRWAFILDFTSLYPSIIIAKNICYTTYNCKSKKYSEININNQEYKFINKEERVGIIPQLLSDFLLERKNIKNRLQSLKLSDLEKLILDKQQWVFKILANSVYGLLGSKTSRDMGFLPGAIATTAWGRQYLLNTKILIENNFNYKVIYGDTDSFIITNRNVNNYISCKKIANEIIEDIHKNNNDIEIKLESIFSIMCLLSKKMYAGISSEDNKIMYKGVINVRKNYPKFIKEIYKETLDMILKEHKKDEILNYVRDKINKLLNNNISLEDLSILKTINAEYKNKMYEMNIFIKRYNKDNFLLEKGSIVECIYIKNNKQYVGDKLFTIEEVKQNNLLIDNRYYFDRYMNNIDNLLEIISINNFSKTVLNEREGKDIRNYFKKLNI